MKTMSVLVRLRRTVRVGVLLISAALLAAGCGGGAKQAGGSEQPGSDDSGEPAEEGEEAEGFAEASEEGGGGEPAAAKLDVPVPPKGAISDEKRAMKMGAEMVLSLKGKDAGIVGKNWSFEEGRKTVIEKVSGSAVTQLAVVYGEREGKGMKGWTPLPTEGKGYTVQVKSGRVVVLDAEGQSASGEESEVAKTEYGYLGKPNPLLAQVIAPKPRTGDKLSLDADGALALIGYMPEMEIGELSVVFNGAEDHNGRKAAALDVKFKSKLREKDIIYALDLGGHAYVDTKTGWVLDLALKGKVKVSGKQTVKGKELDAKGKGEFEFTRSASIR